MTEQYKCSFCGKLQNEAHKRRWTGIEPPQRGRRWSCRATPGGG